MSDKRTPAGSAGENKSSAGEGKKNGWVKTGVAVGIGSAAIVAALLYANKSKGSKKP